MVTFAVAVVFAGVVGLGAATSASADVGAPTDAPVDCAKDAAALTSGVGALGAIKPVLDLLGGGLPIRGQATDDEIGLPGLPALPDVSALTGVIGLASGGASDKIDDLKAAGCIPEGECTDLATALQTALGAITAAATAVPPDVAAIGSALTGVVDALKSLTDASCLPVDVPAAPGGGLPPLPLG